MFWPQKIDCRRSWGLFIYDSNMKFFGIQVSIKVLSEQSVYLIQEFPEFL